MQRSCRRLHRSNQHRRARRDPMFANMKSKVDSKSLVYDKFMLSFLQLEMSKQTSQENLKAISEASGVELEKINSDLGLYKSVLSRMNSAKELQAVLERGDGRR